MRCDLKAQHIAKIIVAVGLKPSKLSTLRVSLDKGCSAQKRQRQVYNVERFGTRTDKSRDCWRQL